MNWRLQTTLAGILGALGLWIVFNPVKVVTGAAAVIPWLLLAAGAVQLISIMFRSRRLLRLIVIPAVTGALFITAGAAMKIGDPRMIGPISLYFVFALVLFGSGAAKLFAAFSMRRSRYFLFVAGSGAVSVLLGLIVLFNWETLAGATIGVFLGLEVIADAVVMAVLSLRDRDGEEAMESLGLDPAAEAAKADAKREALAVKAATEAAEIKAATAVAEAEAAETRAVEVRAAQAGATTALAATIAEPKLPLMPPAPAPAPIPLFTEAAVTVPPIVPAAAIDAPPALAVSPPAVTPATPKKRAAPKRVAASAPAVPAMPKATAKKPAANKPAGKPPGDAEPL